MDLDLIPQTPDFNTVRFLFPSTSDLQKEKLRCCEIESTASFKAMQVEKSIANDFKDWLNLQEYILSITLIPGMKWHVHKLYPQHQGLWESLINKLI